MAQPWALEPGRLRAMTDVIHRWSAGGVASPEVMAEVRADAQHKLARIGTASRSGGKSIAVLPLYGVITQRANMVNEASGSGGTSTQAFAQAFRSALADDAVGHLIIDCDSPGGSCYGTGELADEIRAARGVKPITGVVNSLCASAAYWILSQCDEIFCTPGGEAGSIGVYTAHTDASEAMRIEGLRTTLVSAGKYKTEASP